MGEDLVRQRLGFVFTRGHNDLRLQISDFRLRIDRETSAALWGMPSAMGELLFSIPFTGKPKATCTYALKCQSGDMMRRSAAPHLARDTSGIRPERYFVLGFVAPRGVRGDADESRESHPFLRGGPVATSQVLRGRTIEPRPLLVHID